MKSGSSELPRFDLTAPFSLSSTLRRFEDVHPCCIGDLPHSIPGNATRATNSGLNSLRLRGP